MCVYTCTSKEYKEREIGKKNADRAVEKWIKGAKKELHEDI